MTKLLVVAALLASCSKSYEPSAEDKAEEKKMQEAKERPPEKAPVVKKQEVPTDLGTCHLTATGAVSVDQTSKGGKEATNISYWFEEKERKNMMGIDGFVINCNGDLMRFSMLPGGGKQDGMPFKPKKYDFVKGKGDAGISVGFGKMALSAINGSVDVTAFDARHIAGTVDLSGTLTPGGGDVKVTGQFDLVCPGYSGCQY